MRHLLSTLLLGPVLLAQGKWVRARTPLLPEPDGNRVGSTGQGRCVKLLVLGDSSAAGVGARHQSEALLGRVVENLSGDFTVGYRLLARTGATTADCLQWLQDSESEAFDVVLTALGVNDVTALRSRQRWIAEQTELLQLLQQKFSPQTILVSGLPPMQHFPALPQPLRWYLGARANDFSAALQQLSADLDASFIAFDFPFELSAMAADGFHPGPNAYQIWGKAAADQIVSLRQTSLSETPNKY